MAFADVYPGLRVLAGIGHGSRAFGGPLQLNLALTNRCNIRCVHCYFHSPLLNVPNFRSLRSDRLAGAPPASRETIAGIQRLDADPEHTIAALDDALAMGTRQVQFSGSGECFLHPRALDFMRKACESGADCVANTNGTLLDRGTVDELIRMRFGRLRVTLMAGDTATYLRTHPGVKDDMFERVRAGLLYLKERKAALGVGKPVVKAVYVAVDQNHDGLLDFARTAVEVGAHTALFKPVDDLDDPSMASLVPTGEHATATRRQAKEAAALLKAGGVRHNVADFLCVFQRRLDTAAIHRVVPCYYGWLASMLEPDGDVYACCRCFEPMGNAYQTSFREVWTSERYRRFRSEAGLLPRSGRRAKSCECHRCVHYEANLRVFRWLHPLRWRELQAAATDGFLPTRGEG